MFIEVDTREKPRAITRILAEFERQGVDWQPQAQITGDYRNIDKPRLIIDRKQNLSELCQNVVQQHDRFVRELERARTKGFRLILLVEHGGGIKTLEDVKSWKNPRLKYSKMATTGERLYKILSTMSKKYEFNIEFCAKAETGKRIIELLAEDGWNKEIKNDRHNR
ncbi:MAG: ERCC4 domain-containing protein [Bacillota bacterium]